MAMTTLTKYAAGAALVLATAGLTGCYVAPAYYGPRPYVYAAPAYGPAYGYYRGYGYGGGYYRRY